MGGGAPNENLKEENEQAPDVSPIPDAEPKADEAAEEDENENQDVPLVQPVEVEDIQDIPE